ncbi:MAG: MFS transporter [Thermomicrobium sp.]|nr:MFS transporter [Thermomicrobium sp.]MDW8060042.1 MFS transporter [Thermomicrobium sp.]
MRGSWTEALAALRFRDFRLLWVGQFVSMLGSQMQTVALSWLVYDLTGSPAQLGGIALARAIPTIVLSLFGGTLADQVDRRKLLLVTQSTAALLLGVLAACVTLGWTALPLLYLLAFASAAAMSFDSPARQALVPALVPRERLANALTLNVLAWDVAAVVGPALGGLVIARVSVAAAFWADALSYLAVVAALLAMRRDIPAPRPERRGWHAFLDGLTFVRWRPILWQLMLLDFFAVVLASTTGLLPVFARDVLGVGPDGLGLLFAAPSVGAIVGAALFALVPVPRRPGRVVVWVVVGYGVALAAFGVSRWFWPSLALLAVSGGLDAVSMALRHTVRQLATPDAYRGRVGALASVFSAGGPRLGQFQAGVLASLVGPAGAMVLGGVGCVAVALASRWWGPELWRYTGEELAEVAGEERIRERTAPQPTAE